MSKVGTSLARAQSWHEYCMGQPVDNLWITIGTTLACPMLARVLLVLQHSCQVQSWHGFCMGATCVPCLKLARVLQGCNLCASFGVGMVVA